MLRDRRGRGEVLIVLGMTGLIVAFLVFVALHIYFKNSGIRPGVYFLGYDLTGLKTNDAATKVSQIIDYVYSEPVYLKIQKNLWMLRYQKHFRLQFDPLMIAVEATQIGEKKPVFQLLYDWATLRWAKTDVPFLPVLDRKFTATNVGARLSKFALERVRATPLANGQVELAFQSRGAGIDAIVDSVESSFRNNPFAERRVVVVNGTETSGVKRVALFDPKEGFTVSLGSKTSVVESADPATFDNIVLCCQKINGIMVNPGDTFDFNRVVGERTRGRGWRESATRRTVGIGVGQVSSTMYEPILRIGAHILERRRHSYWYPELKFTSPGLDAAVTDSGSNLRFVNETNIPWLFLMSLNGPKLTFDVKSVQEPQFKIDVNVTKLADVPFKTEWIKDDSVPRNRQQVEIHGVAGIHVRVYRTWLTREDGRKEREERISDDEYQSRQAVVRVPRNFVPPAEPKPQPARAPDPKEELPPREEKRRTDDDDDEPRRPAVQDNSPPREDAEAEKPEPTERRRPPQRDEEDAEAGGRETPGDEQ